MPPVASLLLLLACADEGSEDSGGAGGVLAIVDPTRATHFFDLPFPSDELLTDGRADLSGFPSVEEGPLAAVVDGWVSRIEQTTHGFANNGASYFRFEDALSGLPSQTDGVVDDPMLWVCDSDQGVELLPLDSRFVADPLGDPFWGDNTLVFGPSLGHPPRSGATCAAVVMASAGVQAPRGYALPAGVSERLAAAGVTADPAVATVFTVQDVIGQLQALRDDVDSRLGPSPNWGDLQLRRVLSLSYAPGTTPSGKDASLATVSFEDGGTETTYLAASEERFAVDLGDDWPMAVYQAELPTLNYSGLDDRPYMSPGLAHLADTERASGWIDFDAEGRVLSVPDAEPMRLTISLPKGDDGQPGDAAGVVIWDHGTGGHAYNVVQRKVEADRGAELAQVWAEAGLAVIGRDAPLYGTRYPLIDEGHGASLGFYNIVNLPAFRDNQRQTAVDGHVLQRFVLDGLAEALPATSVDTTRLRRAGHSLGSVTGNLGLAMEPDAWDSGFLSGSGGVFSLYFLETGLLGNSIDPSVLDSLFALFGVDVPEDVTTPNILGAAMGLDEAAWANIDRFHPALQLFQWTMDPSDPMAVARHEDLATTMIIGTGDWQVPDFTSDALCDLALPDCTSTRVAADGDYDPHQVLFRTSQGQAVLEGWVSE